MRTALPRRQTVSGAEPTGRQLLANVVPGGLVALATLLAVLPWGLPSTARFTMPLLAYALVHYWLVRRPSLLPEWLAFASGLAIDVLTNGPLGFWSLTFVAGVILATLCEPVLRLAIVGKWLHFAATLVLLAAMQWGLASLFFMRLLDWQPFAVGAAVAIAAYPVVMLLLRPAERLWPEPANAQLARGV